MYYSKYLGSSISDRALNISRSFDPRFSSHRVSSSIWSRRNVSSHNIRVFLRSIDMPPLRRSARIANKRRRLSVFPDYFDGTWKSNYYISDVIFSREIGSFRLVRSQRWLLGNERFYVLFGNTCTCPYFKHGGRKCKHLFALELLTLRF